MTELASGQQLGKYRLEHLLGSGGMGTVWAAHDADLDRRVALKVLKPGLAGDDMAQVRLLREARAMARLRHPNVITVFDATRIGDRDLVAMELVDGETMASWLDRERRTEDQILTALLSAGRGLAAAHAAGMIHRDFKPHNVLVEHAGRVLVTDFGLARASGDAPVRAASALTPPPVDDAPATDRHGDADATAEERPRGARTPAALDATASIAPRPSSPALDATASPPPASGSSDRGALESPLTHTGMVLGTPAYMAPEQFRGEQADARADQFAFCVTAWEALAGKRPFLGGSFEDLSRAVQDGTPAFADRIPRRFRAILLRGIDRDPARRWPSMNELLRAIERAWRRPRRFAIGGAVLLGLGAVTGGVLALGHRGDHATPAPVAAACPAGASAITAAWSPERRTRLVAIGGDTVAANLAVLDHWAAAWAKAYDANCAQPGDPDFTARKLCFEAARDEISVLFAPPPELIVPGLAHGEIARVLPSPESCVRAPRGIPPPLPTDSTKRAAVIRIRQDLIRFMARVRVEPGSYAELARSTAALLDEAKESGYPAVVADALYTRAILRHVTLPQDSGPEREQELTDAFETYAAAANAAEAAGYDRVRVNALLGQIECAVDLPAQRRDLEPLIQRANVAVTRLGDPMLELVLDALRAKVAQSFGRWSEAIVLTDRLRGAFAQREAAQSAAHMTVVEAQILLMRHASGNLERASALFDALAAASPALTSDPLRIEILRRRGRVDEARALAAGAKPPIPELTAGGGDPAGGNIVGTVKGIALGTPADGDGQPSTLAATRTLATVSIRGDTPDRAWDVPVTVAGEFELDSISPGNYTVRATTSSALGDVQAVQMSVFVTARTSVPPHVTFPAPHPLALPARSPEALVIVFPGAAVPKTTMAVREAVAAAAWWSAASPHSTAAGDPRGAWLAELGQLGDGPAIQCELPGAALADGVEPITVPEAPLPSCALVAKR